MKPWRQLPANVKMSTIIYRSKFRIVAVYFDLPEDVREAAWKSAMDDRPKAERIYASIANSLSYPRRGDE